VHRIGRTGRAGLTGTAISFCDHEEKEFLRDIEKLIDKSIPLVEEHHYPMGDAPIITSIDSKNKRSNKKPNSNPYAKMRRKKNNNNIKKTSQKTN
jgi:ATP-dependent RNA helicase RhlE